MNLNKSVRLLQTKWASRTGWPQRLEWVQLENIRGWNGQRIEFNSPIVAICGENGSGKSTLLQAAEVVYYQTRTQKDTFAGELFPHTPWDKMIGAKIRYSVRQGQNNPSLLGELRRVSDRWVGYKDRPQRDVVSMDLGRLQPLISRLGFFNVAKTARTETDARTIDESILRRMSEIMGREYTSGRLAKTDADETRSVPVVSQGGVEFSGFHHGAGELTIEEILDIKPNPYSLLLIDEIETSLHPRAQRRLMHDLAAMARERDVQIILTTHSPYVLQELPPESRCCILIQDGKKEIVMGVSPDFAMSRMDEKHYPECDLYVEDDRGKVFLEEILSEHGRDTIGRVEISAFGAASVGQSLGIMKSQGRMKRPTLIFLDGDQAESDGCSLLPGGDAPERVVFEALRAKNWCENSSLLDMRLKRSFSEIADACQRAMTSADAHEWVSNAAKTLHISGDVLWQVLCSTWATECLSKDEGAKIVTAVRTALMAAH